MPLVAPLTGSVDRNDGHDVAVDAPRVAPLTGSVDRNNDGVVRIYTLSESLPSRGAWIEMLRDAMQAARALGRSPHGERG